MYKVLGQKKLDILYTNTNIVMKLKNKSQLTSIDILASPVMVDFMDPDLMSKQKCIPVLSFIDCTTQITNVTSLCFLRKINSGGITEGMFNALCSKIIKRIELFSTIKGRKGLKIRTSETMILEILLDNHYIILDKPSSNNFDYIMTKTF